MALKLDTESLRYIAALQNTTGVEVKDCILNENSIIYVIKQGQLGAAIGKGGANVKKLSTQLGKKFHLVELSDDPVKFTLNMLGKITVRNIVLKEDAAEEGGKTVKKIIIEADAKNRGPILGKGGKNIEIIKDLLKRHHEIADVIVR